jgi:hypothetical protein
VFLRVLSLQCLSETVLVLSRIQRHVINDVGLHVGYRYSCQTLMKSEFYRILVHENLSSGSRVVLTDRHDEAISRFSQFFKRTENDAAF